VTIGCVDLTFLDFYLFETVILMVTLLKKGLCQNDYVLHTGLS